MKTFLVSILTVMLFQPNTTAIEQVKSLKQPVIVISRYGSGTKVEGSTFMTVKDGTGNFINLNKDTTLLYLIKKYRNGDTIKDFQL